MRKVKFATNLALQCAAFLFVLALVLPCTARAQGKIELFGGFSYVRGDVVFQQQNNPPCNPQCKVATSVTAITQHPNLFGWEFSAGYKLVPFLSANLDFGEQYGSLNGGSIRLKTYLFGPQLALPGPISPFVHAEFGFAHESVGVFTTPMLISPGSDTSFATVLGGGLDIKAIPFFSLRLIQVDYLRTSLYHSAQNEPRISAGIVFHF